MQTDSASNELVRGEPGRARPVAPQFAHLAEPVFQPLASINLAIDTNAMALKTTDHLAHAVAAVPSCLLTHVQRISLHVKRRESLPAYGAMLDLFVVLGKRGTRLRKRMLALARPLLDDNARGFLDANLAQGISATDVLPGSLYSVLTKSVSGTTDLVKKIEKERHPDCDSLQKAQECLEFGQIDEAQRILEAAILLQPKREQIHHDLLEIYRCTANKTRFDAMRVRLEAGNHPLAQIWASMATSFDRAANQ